MRSTALFVLAFVVAAVTAHAQDPAAVARGKEIYAAHKCAMCHAIEGKGNVKGPLDGVGTRLTADEIRQWHVDPKGMIEKTKSTRKPAMPSYTKLSKEDLNAIVAYLQTLKK